MSSKQVWPPGPRVPEKRRAIEEAFADELRRIPERIAEKTGASPDYVRQVTNLILITSFHGSNRFVIENKVVNATTAAGCDLDWTREEIEKRLDMLTARCSDGQYLQEAG